MGSPFGIDLLLFLSLEELLELAFPLAHLTLFDEFHLLAEFHVLRDDIEFRLAFELHAELGDLLVSGFHLLLCLVHKSLHNSPCSCGNFDIFLFLLAKQFFLYTFDAFDISFERDLVLLL